MIRSFASPQLYIQGPGAFDTQLGQLRRLGNQALVVTDQYVYDLVGKSLISNLTVVGIHGCPFLSIVKGRPSQSRCGQER